MHFNSLILPDGRQLPDSSVVISQVALRRQVAQTQQLLPGGVCPAVLEAKILDPDGQLSLTAGDTVQLLRMDEKGNTRKVGEFILEKPERVGAEMLVLTGYDAVRKLDADLTGWLAGLDGWPYTLAEFAGMVVNRCGLTLTAEAMPNAELEVRQFAAITTGRQLMRWICQACCRFCRATADGNLVLGWFSDSGVTLAPTGEHFYYRGALRFADYATAPIDGVQLRLADGKSSYLWPETGAENPWIITANPILAEASEQMAQALDVIASQLRDLQYTPCEVTIPANEELMAGQMVNVETPSGEVIRSCILESERSGARDTLRGQGSKMLSTEVSAQDRAALEALNAAASAVANQTQADIFDKLTDKGALQGLFMKDGQLFINASYLVTGLLRSADGKTFYLDLDNGVLKGSFAELAIAGKTVEQIAGTAAEDAVNGQTQADIFNRLTDNGTLQGLFMRDGQLYINADFLAAGVIRSADGTVEIDLAANTVTIHTGNGKLVLAAGGLYGYGSDGVQTLVLKPGAGAGSPTLLNSFQSEAGLTVAAGKSGAVLTLGQPGAKTEIRGSSISLLEKEIEWQSNGDGTYSLIGR